MTLFIYIIDWVLILFVLKSPFFIRSISITDLIIMVDIRKSFRPCCNIKYCSFTWSCQPACPSPRCGGWSLGPRGPGPASSPASAHPAPPAAWSPTWPTKKTQWTFMDKSFFFGPTRACNSSYLLATYLLPICYLLVIYLLPTCYLIATYLLFTCYLLASYLLPICHIVATYLLPTCYQLATYLLPTCYLFATYLQHLIQVTSPGPK